MTKVVVTGIGTVNPIAMNTNEFVESLKEMAIGIDYITQFDTSDQKVKIGAEINNFDPEQYLDKRTAKRYDRFLQLAIAAADEAIKDAGLFEEQKWRENAGVVIGSGIGGFKTLYREFLVMNEKGPKFVSPFLIPMMIADMASGVVAIHYGLKGPNFSTVSACASSIHSLITSVILIQSGEIDICVTGGSEAVIDPMPIAAFANMMALSQRNDEPKKASRPFDKDRDGFVMGEGAGILILESEEHAKARGAKIYGYIEGFGMTGDAYHISQSEPNGEGAARAIKRALEMANLNPSDIDLVNCHATSTPVGDTSEIRALKSIFGQQISRPFIQSTKTLLGHTLGAAGAIELIAAILETQHNFIHGMPNLDNPDEEMINLNIPKETKSVKINRVLKNSFGFGGHNASIIFVKY
ncbi:MAG: beta-ketoacyl-ACP synthase II [Defluviitoga tunisiensis]|uniref:3-oxoacyl-[acyl-carrier-protein] synthase 2 n=1 Tax=Defluviitoga tunisiensis TaxID=1006576 RepID=A0A0C7P1J0_DEFTU|nr:beta-ketoacyl-ACP synthase II [Defluviitoga tunisiensis]CEP77844.1 3-oxoacyl-[acyl-carrier-protein] synthase 2 [Defluviitoga tunisiensis]